MIKNKYINMMKDRIIKIMDESGLSASKFAEKIGVPRSGLSHVLSGRNKPSLDYVIKLINAFPEVDVNWLLNGVKSTSNFENKEADLEAVFETNQATQINDSLNKLNKQMGGQADKMIDSITNVSSKKQESRPKTEIRDVNSRKVERIVFFYEDGSFKEYTP